MNKIRKQALLILLCCIQYAASGQIVEVKSVAELESRIKNVAPSTTIVLEDGIYANLKLIVRNSGTEEAPITIKAKNPGNVIFSGDVKVALYGEYIVLEGIYFKDGARNEKEWKSHGPGLVAIYGSHNRITQCAFHCFDSVNSAYITTSIPESGVVPQYCRIDHCSFTEKITFDQVINLNNTPKANKTEGAKPGVSMYHRIDHCFFANPKKPGNAGGGIRVGYWRKDFGRCLVDSNLFMRQDSEAEIITSKSRENVYFANTFLNCRGTMNFRHGDKQVAINNFFIANDTKFQYGGLFVWGSGHLIAANHFELPTTIKSRGNAAVYLNPGARASEHALAFDICICNNIFESSNGYAINFHPLTERRKEFCKNKKLVFEYPNDIKLFNNQFHAPSNKSYSLFKNDFLSPEALIWENNISDSKNQGMIISTGVDFKKKIKRSKLDKDAYKPNEKYRIKGIPDVIFDKAGKGLYASPLTFKEVGPSWLLQITGTYAQTGQLSKEVKKSLKLKSKT